MKQRYAITAAIVTASLVGSALATAQTGQHQAVEAVEPMKVVRDAPAAVPRIAMRVTALNAGAEAAEVERVMGRPTKTAILTGSSGDNRVLVYADEPVRTSVTIRDGRVTAVELEFDHIDETPLPAWARIAKPGMVRSAVLALLGKASKSTHWHVSGLAIERLLFTREAGSEVSVFLADGVVIDVKPGSEKPWDLKRIVLPPTVSDNSIGRSLRIGLNPKQAAALLGPAVWAPIHSSREGQDVLYTTYREHGGCDFVSLTFINKVLTTFSIWEPDATIRPTDAACATRVG